MSNRRDRQSEAAQLVRRQLLDIGRELRMARFSAGMRLVDVARAARTSASTISRVERGLARRVSYERMAFVGTAVGMKVSVRAYPAGRRLLDTPQLRLFHLLRARAHASWGWRTEVQMPIPGDLRAADACATIPGCVVMFEIYTRFWDFQGQSRAALLEQRDLGAHRLVLVVGATTANRRALQEAGGAVLSSFPLGTKSVLRALAEGRDPGANGIVVL